MARSCLKRSGNPAPHPILAFTMSKSAAPTAPSSSFTTNLELEQHNMLQSQAFPTSYDMLSRSLAAVPRRGHGPALEPEDPILRAWLRPRRSEIEHAGARPSGSGQRVVSALSASTLAAPTAISAGASTLSWRNGEQRACGSFGSLNRRVFVTTRPGLSGSTTTTSALVER